MNKRVAGLRGMALAVLALGTLAGPVRADAGSARDADFLAALQQAVAYDDHAAVSDMVTYPFRISTGRVSTPEQFLKYYDAIFTSNVKRAIANQSADSLFYRDQGVMIGDGEVWFNAFCDDGGQDCDAPQDKIFSFNN